MLRNAKLAELERFLVFRSRKRLGHAAGFLHSVASRVATCALCSVNDIVYSQRFKQNGYRGLCVCRKVSVCVALANVRFSWLKSKQLPL